MNLTQDVQIWPIGWEKFLTLNWAVSSAKACPRPKSVANILSQYAYIESELERSPERMTRLHAIAKQLWAMSMSCKIAVCIPAYREAGIIENTLAHYTRYQTCMAGKVLNPELFEINILVNRPNSLVERDECMHQEIQAFRRKYPEYRINLAEVVYDFQDKPVIWLIFKDIADAVILRNLFRDISDLKKARLILRTAGADVEALNPMLLSRTLDVFDDIRVTAHRGETRLPPKLLQAFPLLNVMQTFAVFMLRQYHGSHTTNGPFSYTAEAYGSVDGFDPKKILGEEIDLAQRIWRQANLSAWEQIFLSDDIKDVLNNPRRQVHALLWGSGMAGRYQDFGRSLNEQAVRELSTSWRNICHENLPSCCLLTAENLSREMSAYYGVYLKIGMAHHTSPEHIELLFARAFEFCGITEYSFQRNADLSESSISIQNIGTLTAQIQKETFDWASIFR